MIDFRTGDNRDLIRELPDDSICVSICSPPYKTEDGWESIDFLDLFSQLYRVHKKNSCFFLNFGHLANFKERPYLTMMEALKAKWILNDTIIWLKTQYSPVQGNKRLNNLTEFVFLLIKGAPELNRLSIGVPFKDKANIGRYSDVDLRCGGNCWTIPYETIQKKSDKWHHDVFPVELPLRCLKLSGVKEGVALDIFVGSGSTGLAAARLGLDFIGFEKNPVYENVFAERLKQL